MAWKCDRCGMFYTEQVESDYNIVDVNRGYLDLCPDCQKKLVEFITEYEEVNKDAKTLI